MAYDLPMEGRGEYVVRLAAGANLTEARGKEKKILRWQLEKEYGVHYGGETVLAGKNRTRAGRYPHLVAVYAFGKGKVPDIRTRQEEIVKWVRDNDIIMAAIAGMDEARRRHKDITSMAESGQLDDWKEKELHDLVNSISDAVPEPPPEAEGCCKLCKRGK